MKKIISMALIAGMVLSGTGYVSAGDVTEPVVPKSAVNDNTVVENATEITEVVPASGPEAPAEGRLCKLVAPIKKLVVDYKKPLAVVGILAAAYAGHKVMVSVCPWYKRLVGADEDEDETKTPKLNPRVMNPARPF